MPQFAAFWASVAVVSEMRSAPLVYPPLIRVGEDSCFCVSDEPFVLYREARKQSARSRTGRGRRISLYTHVA